MLGLCCLILTVILLICLPGQAQKEADNWYFGIRAGLSFASGSPVALTNGQTNTIEGVATISNRNGQLLFYTDGITVWNKNHQVMQNGTGLKGHPSSTQSGVIVPQPGNDTMYFVFTTGAGGQGGLRYSVVNMNLDSGRGAVTQKNNLLLDPSCEKITAVRHCNNKDVWVLGRQWKSDLYHAWLVTRNGLIPNGRCIGHRHLYRR